MNHLIKKIIKQAWAQAREQKHFWPASLFLVWPSLVRWVVILLLVADLLGYAFIQQPQIEEQTGQNLWWGIVNLGLIIVLVSVYFLHKGSHIILVRNLVHKDLAHPNADDLKKVYWESAYSVTRLMSQSFNFLFVGLLLCGLVWWPVVYLIGQGYGTRALILGIAAGAVFLLVMGVLLLVAQFAPMFVVGYGFPTWVSIKASLDFIQGRWKFICKLAAWLVLIEVIGVIGALVLGLVAALPFVILAQIFYDVGGSGWHIALLTLAQIAGFVVFFISQALAALFVRTAWAVAFFEIVRPIKLDQESKDQPMPETIT